LLVEWREGDQSSLERLVTAVYAELRRMAHRYMAGERAGLTLATTDLVNEAYLRLVDSSRVNWHSRAHFFAICAQLMRRILVDAARSRRAQKRGGGIDRVSLDAALSIVEADNPEIEQIDEALNALAEVYPRKARVVELRFFGGLDVDSTAEVIGVSADTVLRDWNFAKAWLRRELSRGASHAG
jgi:RNA polymerase sigma factor (TIGR02999 family)